MARKLQGHEYSSSEMFTMYKSSRIPKGGWNNRDLASRNGQRMIQDLVRIQKVAMTRGMVKMTRYLDRMFTDILEDIIKRVEQGKIRRGQAVLKNATVANSKATYEFTVDPFGDEALWAEAIESVMGGFDAEIINETTPIIQSTMADVWDKTAVTIGGAVPRDLGARTLALARGMGFQIRRVNETTRRQITDVVSRGIENGEPVNQVARTLRDNLSTRMRARIPTIARTEMGRASDAGRAQALKTAGTVKYVEVFGCNAVEAGIPTYQGRPTCNIRDVPAHDADKLEFHINHTGTIIPQEFWKDEPDEPEEPDDGPPEQELTGFPTLDQLTDTGESIGGSTGARLMQDQNGKKWVLKQSHNEAQLKNEYLADRLYESQGIPVPRGTLYVEGTRTSKLTEYIEGAETLADFKKRVSKREWRTMRHKLREGFHVDALLANRDVIGLDYDNILVRDGIPYRVDNGGALFYRAQGELKTDFGTEPMDLFTMRGYKFQTGANLNNTEVFGDFLDPKRGWSMYDHALRINKMDVDAFKEVFEDVAREYGIVDAKTVDIVNQRLIRMQEIADKALDFKKDGWIPDYAESVLLGMSDAKNKKIFDPVAGKSYRLLKDSGDLVDEYGLSFGGLRGDDDSVSSRFWQDIRDEFGYSGVKFIEGWGVDQRGGSWHPKAIGFKYYLAKKRFKDKRKLDRFWASKAGTTEEAKELYDDWLASSNMDERTAQIVLGKYIGVNQQLLEEISLPNQDKKRRLLRVLRTEDKEVLDHYNVPRNGGNKSFNMPRGINESTSLFKTVVVAGDQLTQQAIPYTRVTGNYLLQDSRGRRFFLGDDENEVTAVLDDIDFITSGTVEEGQIPNSSLGRDASRWGVPLRYALSRVRRRRKGLDLDDEFWLTLKAVGVSI